MAIYYFDTSALVKRYALEDGRKWVQEITDPNKGNQIYIARISGAEAVAAFTKKVRERTLSVNDAARIIGDFTLDFTTQYEIIEITDVVVTRAMSLIQSHKLRGYDGVQLAASIELNDTMRSVGFPGVGVSALTLVAPDSDLSKAALAEGLIVINPINHARPDDKTP